MNKRILTSTVFALGFAFPVYADPSVGFGLSLSFGSGNVETGVGVRIFSDNERDKAVASIGLDYMFQSQRLRPTIGAAYLGDNIYLGLDLGFDLQDGGIDYGISAGGVDTKDKPVAVTPVVGGETDDDTGEDNSLGGDGPVFQ